jgi:hypothetical protein
MSAESQITAVDIFMGMLLKWFADRVTIIAGGTRKLPR